MSREKLSGQTTDYVCVCHCEIYTLPLPDHRCCEVMAVRISTSYTVENCDTTAPRLDTV